ncbi:MAG: NAD-dependent deacylase [Candidatus Cloacimonetes bacterium]|nr:NAD-dependent deacylase [Candidatus Cloacimonadota bacterium]
MKTNYKFHKEDKITALTGAGISAESGIKTFRDRDGLWENHRIEEVASPVAFSKNPEMVWEFYKQRYLQLAKVSPNSAHFALKKMEDFCSSNFNLITQNVDGLHQIAGNINVLEMHGSLRQCFCSKCLHSFEMKEIDFEQKIPKCDHCSGNLRPNIVWFGEMPYEMEKIDKILENTKYFIVIGTSGIVYPAARFLSIAKYFGAKAIEINLEYPINSVVLDEFHLGKAGILLPELIEKWIT